MIENDEAVKQAENLLQQFGKAELQENIGRRYELAKIRCLPLEEVIHRVRELHYDDQQDALLYRLLEVSFNNKQVQLLCKAITHLCRTGDSVPYRQKPPIDRAISRLLRALPDKVAWKIADAELLHHHRKARRLVAYLLMKRVEIDESLAKLAWENYLQFGDIEALHIVVRSSALPADVETTGVLTLLEEDYWRARFLAALLTNNRSAAYALSSAYPLEFVWAVGRAADEEALPVLRGLLNDHMGDLKFMGFYIWALGLLGARDDLESLHKWVEMQSSAATETFSLIR